MCNLKVSQILIISLVLLGVACDSKMTAMEAEAKKVEAQLLWLTDVNPIQMAKDDLNNDNIRFHQVCSYSCSSVGVGNINGKRCYPFVSQVPIKGTSDVILSKEHGRLMKVAYSFAKQYNTEIVKHLREQGVSKCNKGVDWGAAHHELTKFVWSLEDDISKQGHVGVFPVKKSNQPDFTVLLPDKVTDELNLMLCKTLADYLPNEIVSIKVNARKNIETIQTIWCNNGSKTNDT